VEGLLSTLRGKAIRPSDEAYDAARRVYNAMIDRQPRLIVQCADVADVVRCVNFARDEGLPPAVRCGSHSVPGFGTCDGGRVIDLSGMKGIRVDPARRVARVDGGCTWHDFDHATHVFGLATPGGIISTTGVGGLTLGGGFGHLSRRYGLSCDNLISADVVTADGRMLTASATENQDLFWAIRGGGGNFGVVTSFEFRLHPVGTVYAGPVLYPLEKAAGALRFFAAFMAGAPRELSAFFAFLIVPPAPPFPEHLHMKTMCGMVYVYSGDLEKGEQLTRPLREFGPPAFALGHPAPYPAVSPDPAPMPRYREWVRSYWSALHPYSAGGAYVNFLMDEGDDRIASSYRGNYVRLAAVKRKYDPGNLFRVNQNIRPAAM
jgi:FAD/FMN-containing dehydrogenase